MCVCMSCLVANPTLLSYVLYSYCIIVCIVCIVLYCIVTIVTIGYLCRASVACSFEVEPASFPTMTLKIVLRVEC